ncbi:Signal recognition particle receptor subunit beta [Cyphellophora attinorum]|uniref:Signal recognition particle receptor subunit beta n=1 Tax=Cyphellophora attinorum TaxID=1664694 RepID=A0A0N1NZH4_9EURO|nr:Signal recognition particle receptor subunit beta [Phialophora attinorum]KPI37367.1 Signal recognition particle receptor subunit beta [Phialophora attinorum]
MAWSSPDSWATRMFSGDPWVILIAFLTTLALPALLHLYFYTTSARVAHTPTIVLLGPANSGKTALLTLLQQRSGKRERPEASPTRASQVPTTTRLLLPSSVPLGSNKYRSKNDASLKDHEKNRVAYNIIDTPGHGKLREEQALAQLQDPAVRGLIFVVDAGALDRNNPETLTEPASYLHDALLALQLRKTGKGGSSVKTDVRVLIAANKQDLFTATPPEKVKEILQTELERVKESRRRGISTVGKEVDDDDDNVLGGAGEDKFSFEAMREEYGIVIDVIGGSVRTAEPGVGKWEEWIGGLL